MGYRLGSITVIGRDDYHSYFAYFLPSTRMKYEWINQFFEDRFDSIATKIGPEGVIIAPLRHALSRYRDEIVSELYRAANPIKRSQLHYLLSSGFPFLIVSRHPIGTLLTHSNEEAAVALNLAAMRDADQLAELLDTLIDAALRSVDDMLECIPDLSRRLLTEPESQDGGLQISDFLQALELKPNVMGVGLNINEAIRIVQRLQARRKRRKFGLFRRRRFYT